MLRQGLINLLGNAIKFTDEGQVTLSVEAIDEKIEFAVEDSGIGIAAEQREEIFQPFAQVTESSRRYDGTGLGLAISKELVVRLGGVLEVDSRPGIGSRFNFLISLPAANRPVVQPNAERRIKGYEGHVRRVLIVDDNTPNRAVLVGLLEPLGFECIQALDGNDCLAKVSEAIPDIVLMDLVMPGIGGLQTTRRLRADPALTELKVLALSASAFDINRQQCLDAGCDDFLAKPVQPQALLDVIAALLNLEWIEEAPVADLPEYLTTDSIGEPVQPVPEAIAAALLGAARKGHARGVIDQAQALEALGEPHAAVAQQLHKHARAFSFDAVVALVERSRNDTPPKP